METSLHKQLKEVYADGFPDAQIEATLGRYRIDVLRDDALVEIQHGTLTAIRDKIAVLLKKKHHVLVVKPIIARKRLVKLESKGGKVVSSRYSPKRGTILDLFHELIHFTRVFPHKRLTLEVPLVEVDELRYPGHGRRRWKRDNDFVVEDQLLVKIQSTQSFTSVKDLIALLPDGLPSPFDTAELASGLGVNRWIAQRMAYCLRKTGAAKQVGKRGNAILHKISSKSKAA